MHMYGACGIEGAVSYCRVSIGLLCMACGELFAHMDLLGAGDAVSALLLPERSETRVCHNSREATQLQFLEHRWKALQVEGVKGGRLRWVGRM